MSIQHVQSKAVPGDFLVTVSYVRQELAFCSPGSCFSPHPLTVPCIRARYSHRWWQGQLEQVLCHWRDAVGTQVWETKWWWWIPAFESWTRWWAALYGCLSCGFERWAWWHGTPRMGIRQISIWNIGKQVGQIAWHPRMLSGGFVVGLALLHCVWLSSWLPATTPGLRHPAQTRPLSQSNIQSAKCQRKCWLLDLSMS